MPDMGITVTDDSVSPILQLSAWLFIATTTLLLVFRFVSRFFLKSNQSFGWDDSFICCSFVFGLGVWVTWLIPENSVFRQSMDNPSHESLNAVIKVIYISTSSWVEYARELLYIASIAFSKLSVCANISSLSPNRTHQFAALVLRFLLIAWLVSSWLVTAFQCGTRGPWELSEADVCINQLAFFSYLDATSIISDVFLVALPAWIIYPLCMPLRARVVILSFYSFRILVIGVTIVEFIYLPRHFQNDFTLRAFPYYIAQQSVAFFAIATSCILYFWSLLRSFESGRICGNDSTFQSEYPLGSQSRSHDRRLCLTVPVTSGQHSTGSNSPPSRQASDGAMP
ncbi:hypothetical protein GGR51DRAFT_559610 [Nemania sp. FL0031]|nr:hypothetical protein GGR51DRAFT_559610 [Nemania sp. FL0031]